MHADFFRILLFLAILPASVNEFLFFVDSSGWGKVGRAFFERHNAGVKHGKMQRGGRCLINIKFGIALTKHDYWHDDVHGHVPISASPYFGPTRFFVFPFFLFQAMLR
jgi:hypothetical protein